jgi:transposase
LPWKESSPVTERERFIDAYMQRKHTVAELSRRFGISRKTGYKWIERYMSGLELTDRSRRPHRSPNAVAQAMEDYVVAARKAHPRWGTRKASRCPEPEQSRYGVSVGGNVCSDLF